MSLDLSDGCHLPAMLFYPRDFVSDSVVESMTTQEVGAYILLICKAWFETPVGSIPDDDRTLSRWSRMTLAAWKKARPKVLAAFHFEEDLRWHQPRMKKEHQKALILLRDRESRARKAAESRWLRKNTDSPMLEQCSSNAQAMLEECKTKPNQTNKEKIKKERPAPPPLGGLQGGIEFPSPRIAWTIGDIPTDVVDAIEQLPHFQNASLLKLALGKTLRSLGFKVHFEVPVADRGDGTPGRIDLAGLRGEQVLAIEGDRINSREKSIAKLTAFRQPGMVVLRAPRGPRPEGLTLPEGFEVKS